jgi:hypothetical protein
VHRDWVRDSYDFYDGILRSDEAEKAGVSQVSGYIFSSKYPAITRVSPAAPSLPLRPHLKSPPLSLFQNKLLEGLLPTYRQVNQDELSICPGPWEHGAYFTTLLIESGDFLPWARAKCVVFRVLKNKQKQVSFGLSQVFYGLSHIYLLSTNETFFSRKLFKPMVKTRKPCRILCRTVHKNAN